MRELRAALVSVSPLLTDLMRHVLDGRVQVTVVAELTDPEELPGIAGTTDVVLLGSPSLLAAAREAAVGELLVLSDDLGELQRPTAELSVHLTIENLVKVLRQIAEDLDLRSRSNPDPRMNRKP